MSKKCLKNLTGALQNQLQLDNNVSPIYCLLRNDIPLFLKGGPSLRSLRFCDTDLRAFTRRLSWAHRFNRDSNLVKLQATSSEVFHSPSTIPVCCALNRLEHCRPWRCIYACVVHAEAHLVGQFCIDKIHLTNKGIIGINAQRSPWHLQHRWRPASIKFNFNFLNKQQWGSLVPRPA